MQKEQREKTRNMPNETKTTIDTQTGHKKERAQTKETITLNQRKHKGHNVRRTARAKERAQARKRERNKNGTHGMKKSLHTQNSGNKGQKKDRRT